jgi:hypothetical protein
MSLNQAFRKFHCDPNFRVPGTFPAHRAFVQRTASIGHAYRPFRGNHLISLGRRAEIHDCQAIEKVNQKAPPADGNAGMRQAV